MAKFWRLVGRRNRVLVLLRRVRGGRGLERDIVSWRSWQRGWGEAPSSSSRRTVMGGVFVVDVEIRRGLSSASMDNGRASVVTVEMGRES